MRAAVLGWGMHCIVTAGPTYEPLDEVRRLTNFSTGRLGTELANHLVARGHRVTLLLGVQATWGGPREAQKVIPFTTTADLRAWFDKLSRARPRVGAIFHAAAVSDFTFGHLYTRDAAGELHSVRASKKIPTRHGRLFAELVPTAKILAELRGWYPQARITGWKYEANGGRADALAASRRQLAECQTDGCVANGPAYGRGFALVTAAGQPRHCAKVDGLFAELVEFIG